MSRSAWRDRLQAAPLWALFLYFSVSFGVMSLFFHPSDEARTGSSAAVSGLLFGTLMTGVMAYRRHREDRLTGAGVRTQLIQALRSGEPPSDVSLDAAFLGLIQKRRRELERAAKINPWMFGGLLVISLVFAIEQPEWLALAALFGLLLVLNPRRARNAQDQLNTLERTIRQRTVAGQEPGIHG